MADLHCAYEEQPMEHRPFVLERIHPFKEALGTAVMDQFTRRFIGFGVQAGDVDGVALCRMFNTAISTQNVPYYPSSDDAPLFRYHCWQVKLRVLNIHEIKSSPYAPLSHPVVNG